jgi:dTDP-4-amino-4,6-dideoxygalactose transaminase
MKIPIAKPYFDQSERLAVSEVLESGWISQGAKSVEFENALAKYVGVKHGRAVNSGTSAIHCALLACGVQSEDEVIVPAFTCVATLHPIECIGARPVIVDIELDTFGLDPGCLQRAISPRTKAVIVVHLFGLAAKIEEVLPLVAGSKIKVIEDAALGLGARIGERYAGSLGDAACLSFHPRKLITTGEGGMVLSDSDQIAARVAELRNYGASVPAWERHKGRLFDLPAYHRVGYNYKLTDLQAAIGLEQSRKLSEILARRRQIARRYDAALAHLDWLQLPREPVGRTHAYQSYVCLLQVGAGGDRQDTADLRQKFWKHLAELEVASVQGAQAMGTIDYYHHRYGWNPHDFPAALLADVATVSLPIYPALSEPEQDRVIQAVCSFCPDAAVMP